MKFDYNTRVQTRGQFNFGNWSRFSKYLDIVSRSAEQIGKIDSWSRFKTLKGRDMELWEGRGLQRYPP